MTDGDDVWMVVGLGNPGPSYSSTRHNVGYLVTDLLAGRMGGSWRAHRSGRGYVVEGRLGQLPGIRVVLARARAYMNGSGPPVATLARFYRIPADRVVAVHDELDLPFGTVRLKYGGGDNGHNGLRSLRQALRSGDFYRVRFGVGRPRGHEDPADFVLSPFAAQERRELDGAVDRAADAVETLVVAGLARAQNAYH